MRSILECARTALGADRCLVFAALAAVLARTPAVAQDDLRCAASPRSAAGRRLRRRREAAVARSPPPATPRVGRRSRRWPRATSTPRKADGAVVIGTGRPGRTLRLRSADRRQRSAKPRSRALEKIQVNNALRRAVRAAIGTLTLMQPRPGRRLAAAETMARAPDPEALEALDAALAAETDAGVRAAHGAGARRGAARLRPAAMPRRSRRSARSPARRPRRAGAADAAARLGEPRRSAAAAEAGIAEIEQRAGAVGGRRRTSGSACRSARCCCSPRSASPSPSA